MFLSSVVEKLTKNNKKPLLVFYAVMYLLKLFCLRNWTITKTLHNFSMQVVSFHSWFLCWYTNLCRRVNVIISKKMLFSLHMDKIDDRYIIIISTERKIQRRDKLHHMQCIIIIKYCTVKSMYMYCIL